MGRALLFGCCCQLQGSATIQAVLEQKRSHIRRSRWLSRRAAERSVEHTRWTARLRTGRYLTPPSSGRSKGRLAPFGRTLMSNVRAHQIALPHAKVDKHICCSYGNVSVSSPIPRKMQLTKRNMVCLSRWPLSSIEKPRWCRLMLGSGTRSGASSLSLRRPRSSTACRLSSLVQREESSACSEPIVVR